MSKVFAKSMELKMTQSDDSQIKWSVWGACDPADYDKLKTKFDADKTNTGAVVMGLNARYIETVAVTPMEVSDSDKLVPGQLLCERDTKGYIYMKGKLPNNQEKLDLIVNSILNNSVVINEAAVIAVTPRVNVGNTVRK